MHRGVTQGEKTANLTTGVSWLESGAGISVRALHSHRWQGRHPTHENANYCVIHAEPWLQQLHCLAGASQKTWRLKCDDHPSKAGRRRGRLACLHISSCRPCSYRKTDSHAKASRHSSTCDSRSRKGAPIVAGIQPPTAYLMFRSGPVFV